MDELSLGTAFTIGALPQWVVDRQTLRILAVNDAVAVRYGYRRDESLSMGFLDLHAHDEHAAAESLLRGPSTSGVSPSVWRHVTPTGAHWVHLAISDLDHHSRPARLVQAIDANAEIRLLRERDAARSQAEAAVRMKDAMVATVGQEVRQQLAPILPALAVMEQRISLEIGVQARESVKRHVQALVRLVERLIDAAHLQQGKASLQREIVDLRTIVQDVATLHASDLTARGLHFDLRLPASPVWVALDVRRFHHAISNLLVNARHQTAPGGGIWVHVTTHADGAHVVVGDNGRGIPETSLAHIFEPFALASSLTGGGMGLGLSVVRAVVELHDGQVAASSAGQDQGSEFVVTLPLCTSPGVKVSEDHLKIGQPNLEQNG